MRNWVAVTGDQGLAQPEKTISSMGHRAYESEHLTSGLSSGSVSDAVHDENARLHVVG